MLSPQKQNEIFLFEIQRGERKEEEQSLKRKKKNPKNHTTFLFLYVLALFAFFPFTHLFLPRPMAPKSPPTFLLLLSPLTILLSLLQV